MEGNTATTDATETDRSTIEYETTEAAIDDTNSSKVSRRLRKLQEATDDAADSYSMTVERAESYGRVTYRIQIESPERFWNGGELGDANYRVTLGPRGGLRRAVEWSDVPGSKKRKYTERHDTVRVAWSVLLQSISSAR